MQAAITQKPALLRQWFFAKAFSRQAKAGSGLAGRGQARRKPKRRPAKYNVPAGTKHFSQKVPRLGRLAKAA